MPCAVSRWPRVAAFWSLLLAVGQHWYRSGSEDRDTMLAILLCVVPVLAAVSYLCGPLMPVSLRRQLGRAARHWR